MYVWTCGSNNSELTAGLILCHHLFSTVNQPLDYLTLHSAVQIMFSIIGNWPSIIGELTLSILLSHMFYWHCQQSFTLLFERWVLKCCLWWLYHMPNVAGQMDVACGSASTETPSVLLFLSQQADSQFSSSGVENVTIMLVNQLRNFRILHMVFSIGISTLPWDHKPSFQKWLLPHTACSNQSHVKLFITWTTFSCCSQSHYKSFDDQVEVSHNSILVVSIQPFRKWAIWWITKVANQKFIHLVNYYYSYPYIYTVPCHQWLSHPPSI